VSVINNLEFTSASHNGSVDTLTDTTSTTPSFARDERPVSTQAFNVGNGAPVTTRPGTHNNDLLPTGVSTTTVNVSVNGALLSTTTSSANFGGVDVTTEEPETSTTDVIDEIIDEDDDDQQTATSAPASFGDNAVTGDSLLRSQFALGVSTNNTGLNPVGTSNGASANNSTGTGFVPTATTTGFASQNGLRGGETPTTGFGSQGAVGLSNHSTPAFGASTTNGFGSQSAAGFGGQSTPGFGGPTTPGFGGPTTPGFGGPTTPGFGGQTTPGLGGQTTPGFGGQTTPGFGGPTTPGFGGPTTPGFGSQTTPGFGGQTTSGFGGQTTPGFGAQSTTGFGNSGVNGHGSTTFGSQGGAAFGSQTTSGFGTSGPANQGVFGGQTGFGSQTTVAFAGPGATGAISQTTPSLFATQGPLDIQGGQTTASSVLCTKVDGAELVLNTLLHLQANGQPQLGDYVPKVLDKLADICVTCKKETVFSAAPGNAPATFVCHEMTDGKCQSTNTTLSPIAEQTTQRAHCSRSAAGEFVLNGLVILQQQGRLQTITTLSVTQLFATTGIVCAKKVDADTFACQDRKVVNPKP
jgi:nuclear pore complex protein Nup98-Nup96